MKKILISFLIIFICLFFFVKKNQIKQKEELVFWTLQLSSFSDYINPILKDFEKKNNIKVKWIDIPYSEGEKRTLASVLTDNPPDLVNLSPDFSISLAQKGALFFIDKKDVQNFPPEIMNSLKYDKKYYAFPFYATCAVNLYNKNLLNKIGLKPAKNYEEINYQTKIIKEKLGIYAYLPTLTENDTFLKILNKFNIFDYKTITSQPSKDIFNEYKYLYSNDLIPKESLTQTHQEALEKYMAKKTVYINIGSNFINQIKENAPDTFKDTDVSTQLTKKNGKYDFSLMNLVIPQKAKHKELAVKLALLITNKENQLNFAKKTTVLPVNKYALEDEYFKTYKENDIFSKARFISAKQLKNIQEKTYFSKNQKEILNLINNSVQEVLLSKKSTSEILENLSKQWSVLSL